MAIYMWREHIPQELCFTANTASSTVALNKTGSPTTVTLETSTDGSNWSTYTFGNTITLSNVWDKVYWRNSSDTVTGFSTSSTNFYKFVMSWSISASWDVSYLLCKTGTTDLSLSSTYCFSTLFSQCTSLTTTPKLTATVLAERCYNSMFQLCTNLETLPKLPVLTLANYCYSGMFYWCTKIKLSTTQTWEYQTAYRIPTTWTWTAWTNSLNIMFTDTWWTFTWTPSINTTYYTSNTLV